MIQRILLLTALCFSLLAHAKEAPPDPYADITPIENKALTAETIIARHIEATGGREAYEKIKTMRMVGTATVGRMGIEGELTLIAKAPNLVYSKMEIPNLMTAIQAFDGETAWNHDLMGLREMTGAERATFVLMSDFDGLLSWEKLYSKAELLGRMPVGDQPAYVIRFTPKEEAATPIVNFFHQKSFDLLRTDTVMNSPMGTMRVEITFHEYKVIDGIRTPMKMVQTLPQASVDIGIEKAEFNVEIDDAIFTMPKP